MQEDGRGCSGLMPGERGLMGDGAGGLFMEREMASLFMERENPGTEWNV